MPGFVGELLHAGQVLLIPVLVLCNAFFVAAEFSLVTVRRTRLEELQGKRTPGVCIAHSYYPNPNRMLKKAKTRLLARAAQKHVHVFAGTYARPQGSASVGINRRVVGDERAPQERSSEPS